jgi:hypothetical protein
VCHGVVAEVRDHEGMSATQYRATLKTYSGIHLREGHVYRVEADAASTGFIRLIIYASEYRDNLPTLLAADVYMEIPHDVDGDPFDLGVAQASQAAHTFQLMAVLFNAAVHDPYVTGIYELESGGRFRMQTLPELRPHGDVNTRQTQSDTLKELLSAIPGELPERLRMAVMLYDHALCALHPFRNLEVALRLYPGIENLTVHIMNRLQTEAGLTAEDHARSLGIDVSKADWPYQYRGKIRREHVFTEDPSVFKTLRDVRNDYEHASANPGELRARIAPVLLPIMRQVRRALIGELPLSPKGGELAGGDRFVDPLGNWPTVIVSEGTFEGEPSLFEPDAQRMEFDLEMTNTVFTETEFKPEEGKRTGNLRTTVNGIMHKLPDGATGRITSTQIVSPNKLSDTPQPPQPAELVQALLNGEDVTDQVRLPEELIGDET